MPRKAGTSRAVKGETITIRVPPKTKFALELAARRKHSSISSVVLNLIEPFLRGQESGLMVFKDSATNMGQERVFVHELAWDPYEPDRLVKLALADESLLTYDEELRWKVIKDNPEYWDHNMSPLFNEIRLKWSQICHEAEEQQIKFGSS